MQNKVEKDTYLPITIFRAQFSDAVSEQRIKTVDTECFISKGILRQNRRILHRTQQFCSTSAVLNHPRQGQKNLNNIKRFMEMKTNRMVDMADRAVATAAADESESCIYCTIEIQVYDWSFWEYSSVLNRLLVAKQTL